MIKLYNRKLELVTTIEGNTFDQTVEHEGVTYNRRQGYANLYDEIDAHTPETEAKRAVDEGQPVAEPSAASGRTRREDASR